MNPDTILDALKYYISADNSNSVDYQIKLVNEFLDDLIGIRKWFLEDNRDTFRFISSSLLFIYCSNDDEHNQSNLHSTTTQSFTKKSTKLKMIDFCHVFNEDNDDNHLKNRTRFDGNSGDDCSLEPAIDMNYLFGLNKLIKYYEDLKLII